MVHAIQSPPAGLLSNGSLLADRYEVRGELGSGGFAVVYGGYDRALERQVAIKVLNLPALAHDKKGQDKIVERFYREAKAAASIQHPNVVTVFDIGVTAARGYPYIVMEKLEGRDLDVELRTWGALAAPRALRLVGRALEALGEGHEKGIVHKDLKPSNLFLVNPGTPKESIRILDFGIARLDERYSVLTNTGQIFGTSRYFAPEYIKSRSATPALDVYQMGLILVEVLSGTPAVDSDNPLECVMMHSNGELNLPDELMSSPLGPIIAKALSMDPEARYPNANAFLAALMSLDKNKISLVLSSMPTRRVPSPLEVDEVDGETGIFMRNPPRQDPKRMTLAIDGEVAASRVFIPAPGQSKITPGQLSARTMSLNERHVAQPTQKGWELRSTAGMHSPMESTVAAVERRLPGVLAGALGTLLVAISLILVAVFLFDIAIIPGGRAPDRPLDAIVPDTPDASASPKAQGPRPQAQKEPKPLVQPEAVEVKLVSYPTGALVRMGEQTLGTTPLSVSFEGGDASAKVVSVWLPGREAQTVQLSAFDAPRKAIVLEEIAPEPVSP